MSEAAKEKRKEYIRQWKKENRDKVNASNRKWRQENPDKIKKYQENYWERKTIEG
jgi:hypothetical protein